MVEHVLLVILCVAHLPRLLRWLHYQIGSTTADRSDFRFPRLYRWECRCFCRWNVAEKHLRRWWALTVDPNGRRLKREAQAQLAIRAQAARRG